MTEAEARDGLVEGVALTRRFASEAAATAAVVSVQLVVVDVLSTHREQPEADLMATLQKLLDALLGWADAHRPEKPTWSLVEWGRAVRAARDTSPGSGL